ncbi:MAG: DUF4230 domain-containing protein, partial [Acidimicrobiales bacterium]
AVTGSNPVDDQALYQRAAEKLADAAGQSDLQDRARANTERFLQQTLAMSVTATTRAAPRAPRATMAPKARPADRFTVDGVDMGSPEGFRWGETAEERPAGASRSEVGVQTTARVVWFPVIDHRLDRGAGSNLGRMELTEVFG